MDNIPMYLRPLDPSTNLQNFTSKRDSMRRTLVQIDKKTEISYEKQITDKLNSNLISVNSRKS